MSIKRIKIKELIAKGGPDDHVLVKGWVRTFRSNRFIHVNDGSTINNIQAVVDYENFDEKELRRITTGTCIEIEGKLAESMGKGQRLEIQTEKFRILGDSNPDEYPLQPKKHSMEFLRKIAHLRPRTNTFGAVLRIRHALSFAIHKYFNDNGFVYLHTPIITGSDCEGAGEMFRVTTLDPVKPPLTKEGEINYTEDFFGKETNLTVSGQLEGELGAMALSDIYTFGPTFRAENSNTPRHLAEFWMIEPEMAFYDLKDNMDLAEDFLKSVVRYILENCSDDLEFLANMYDKELPATLEFVINNDFARITYTEAIDILVRSGQKFEFPVSWGVDLQTEHERYLVEKHFRRPAIITDYPRDIKAFYMKQNDDGKTVGAMDVLFPRIGEIIGGSQREENYDKLVKRIKELELNEKDFWWYLDTRKFGTAPHSGFGLGFERMVLFVTGMANIRDVIPFPRTPKNAEF
ncbi:MAG: asparagine--tRNA ligase [Bacteroidales bacterium]|jgi:asparaginyl-tRNA synthetase